MQPGEHRPPNPPAQAVAKLPGSRRSLVLGRVLEAQKRERDRLALELSHVRGLMPLLMKRRNGQRWTPEERHSLQQQLQALASLSPYLVVLALPGSFMVLPVLAWWLDRRRLRRGPRQDAPA